MPACCGSADSFTESAEPSGPHYLRNNRVLRQRFVTCIREPRPKDDGFPQFVSIPVDQKCASRRSAEQSALANMPDQLGIQYFEVRRIDRSQPPQFAAPNVEHLARTIELAGNVHRVLVAQARFRIAPREHRRSPPVSRP